jgi:hypothetical protein
MSGRSAFQSMLDGSAGSPVASVFIVYNTTAITGARDPLSCASSASSLGASSFS